MKIPRFEEVGVAVLFVLILSALVVAGCRTADSGVSASDSTYAGKTLAKLSAGKDIFEPAVLPPGPMMSEDAASASAWLSREAKRYVEGLTPAEVTGLADGAKARAEKEGGATVVSYVEAAALKKQGYKAASMWLDDDGKFVDDETVKATFLEFYRSGLKGEGESFIRPYAVAIAYSPEKDRAEREYVARSLKEGRRPVNEGYVNWPRSWKMAELIEERQFNSFDELIELGYVPYKPAVENIEEIANRKTLNKYTDQVQVLLETVYPQDKAARKMMAKAKALVDYQESYARALTEPDRVYSGYKEIEHLKYPQFFVNDFTGEPMEFGNGPYQLYVEKDGLVQGIVECDVLKIRLPQS